MARQIVRVCVGVKSAGSQLASPTASAAAQIVMLILVALAVIGVLPGPSALRRSRLYHLIDGVVHGDRLGRAAGAGVLEAGHISAQRHRATYCGHYEKLLSKG